MSNKFFALILTAILGLVLPACSVNTETSGPGPEVLAPDKENEPAPEPGPEVKPTPLPTPAQVDPSSVVAEIAKNWSEVKYVFCSAQGRYGVFIDFTGVDLSVNSEGTVQIGSRSCDGSKPFSWQPASQFMATKDANGKVVFAFDFKAGYEDYINFGYFSNSYGVFGGNSGPCSFLKNLGTKGLFDSSPFFACK